MEKLLKIQSELKAPKSQRNDFGKYNYRSCEDILEAAKPLLLKYNCTLTLTDTIECIGGRIYVRAMAYLKDLDNKEEYAEVTAYAREEENKKGMDASQITGAASSYARKYALNGLFLIDDNKDSDATNKHEKESKKLLIKGSAEYNAVIDMLQDGRQTEAREYIKSFQLSKEIAAELKEIANQINA
jgi:hypothetical protein